MWRERAQFTGALFVTGAVTSFVALILLPDWRSPQPWLAITVAACALAAGIAEFIWGQHASDPFAHLLVIGATVAVLLMQVATGGGAAAVAVGLMYVWIAVFSALYFSARVVGAHLSVIAAGQVLAVLRLHSPAPVAQSVFILVTCVACAVCVGMLVHRRHREMATDALTGLANRRRAVAVIEASVTRAKRRGGRLALLFIDLDYFKLVNDSYGHRVGDAVLQAAAARMTNAVRSGDIVARLGGDEFVVICEDVVETAEATAVAARLVAVLRDPMHVDGRALRIGASVGVAVSGDGADDADRLLIDADMAAYEAKKAGRERYVVFDEELRRSLGERAALKLAIEAGLTRGEFTLDYQPQVDLRTGHVPSVEALIRWNRPGHGLVPPNEFIPLAEDSTLINDIGRWVLAEATAQLARWDATGGASDLRMAVNISGRHVASELLPSDVSAALDSAGIHPSRLVIEVTETVLVNNPTAIDNLDALHRLGVGIAVDDFGTGFTSIGELLKMPIDEIKIDRSFVAATDAAYSELVHLMTHAAHTLGARVIAEGIEMAEVARNLAAFGVEYGQGFLFTRPCPADEALEAIQRARRSAQTGAQDPSGQVLDARAACSV